MRATGYIDYAPLPLAVPPRRIGDRFAGWLTWVLLGYALLGRAFAYVGVAPLFIGEVTLLFGVAALAFSRSFGPLWRQLPAKLLVLLLVWGAACTIPYVPIHKFDAFRDAVLWGYGFFALAVAAVFIQNPERFRFALVRYRGFVYVFASLIWIIFLTYQMFGSALPKSPLGGPILAAKGGDILVHLAGVTAFILVGMARPRLPVLLMLALCLGVTVVSNRGGMVSFALATMVVVWLRPPFVKLGKMVYGGLFLVVLLGLVNPKYEIDGNRTVSVESFITNVLSIFGESRASHLEGTKEWRLTWWTKIVDYTFFGEYFLMGKGFGVNLADSDGFQVESDGALRSPHNGHLSFLARSGVPGFTIWVLLQLTWGLAVFRRCLETRRTGDHAWTGIFTFLLAYWLAFMANTTFDVFLEGPMGGIWFWCLFGTGLAALHIHRHHPEVAWD